MSDDIKRKEFLDELFSYMQKRGKECLIITISRYQIFPIQMFMRLVLILIEYPIKFELPLQ